MYELRCLGEATLRDSAGELVHFRSRKHLALLIYMALNADRAHRRERLASMLWTHSDEARARHSLSQALYAVRRLLNGAIHIEGDDLELRREGLQVDALALEEQFEAGDAADAADLYRGDFLEGFWVRNARGYEEWILHERARLAALARDALRQAIRSSRGRGEWAEVRARAERLIRLDPFDEAAYAELMRALWMQGDRAAALERFTDLERVLAVELQTRPSSETESLAARIRERPVRGGWTGSSMLRETEPTIFIDPPFVGRKRELAELADEWSVVATGESRSVALVGTAGIGKTRLAAEFIKTLALDDVTILQGRCYEAEQSLPYGPIAEALRNGLDELELDDVNPLWLAELARIVPEAHAKFGDLPQPAELDGEGGRRRLYEGIAQVFRGACDARPILLFVDDLHWADESSLALLHYLHRRVTNGLYLLTAHRPEEVSTRMASGFTLSLSQMNPDFVTVQVTALTTSESADLFHSLVGAKSDSDAVRVLRRRSNGNPLFAIELARHLKESDDVHTIRSSVPASIRNLFDRRFAALDDRASVLMQQVAFLGSRTSYDVVVAAAGLPHIDVDATLKLLAKAGVLTVNGHNITFRHDLCREIASEQVPEALRRSFHLRAARALINTTGAAGEIAFHFAASGEDSRAFEFALRGADVAEEIFAFEEAANLLELALKHTQSSEDRLGVITRLGRLYFRVRDFKKARPFLEERCKVVCSGDYGELSQLQAERDLLLLDINSSRLPMDVAGQELQRFYKRIASSSINNPRFEAEVLHVLLWTAARSLNATLVEDTIRQIGSIHNKVDLPEVQYSTARSLGIYARYRGNISNAEELLTTALRSAEALGDETAVLDCYLGLSTLPSRNLNGTLVKDLEKKALPLAEKNCDVKRLAGLLVNLAPYHNHTGRTDRAEALLKRAEHVIEAGTDHTDLSTSIAYSLGVAAYLKGDMGIAESRWKQALRASAEGGVLPVSLEALACLGHVELGRGNIQAARDHAARSLRLARRARFLADDRFGLEELLARLRHLAGKTEKALSRLEAIAEESECSDVPLFLTAQLTRMELLARAGHAQKAHEVTATLSAAARAHDASWWIDRANATLARVEIDGSANVK